MFLEEKELLETQQNQDLEEDRQISFDRARSSAASSFPSIGEGYPARWGFFFQTHGDWCLCLGKKFWPHCWTVLGDLDSRTFTWISQWSWFVPVSLAFTPPQGGMVNFVFTVKCALHAGNQTKERDDQICVMEHSSADWLGGKDSPMLVFLFWNDQWPQAH